MRIKSGTRCCTHTTEDLRGFGTQCLHPKYTLPLHFFASSFVRISIFTTPGRTGWSENLANSSSVSIINCMSSCLCECFICGFTRSKSRRHSSSLIGGLTMALRSITIGAEHERHMTCREISTKSAVVFSCTSTPMAVANRVITVPAFLFVQDESARSYLDRDVHTLTSTAKFFGDHRSSFPFPETKHKWWAASRNVKLLFLVAFGPEFEHLVQMNRVEIQWTGWTRVSVDGHSGYPRRSENA